MAAWVRETIGGHSNLSLYILTHVIRIEGCVCTRIHVPTVGSRNCRPLQSHNRWRSWVTLRIFANMFIRKLEKHFNCGRKNGTAERYHIWGGSWSNARFCLHVGELKEGRHGCACKNNEAQPSVSSEAKGTARIHTERPGAAEQQPRVAQSTNIFAQHVASQKPPFAKEISRSCAAKKSARRSAKPIACIRFRDNTGARFLKTLD